MTTNEMKEKIEPYLLGELDAQEAQTFEQAVEADPALACEVERMRSIVGAFECRGEVPARTALERIDCEQTLRTIIRRAERRQSGRGRKIRIWVWCASAAAVAGLILFVGMRPEYTPGTLYDAYFIADQHFETAPSRGGDDLPEDVRLNRALELLDSGQTDLAIELMRPLADDDGAELQDAVRWNLALALLRKGQRREAVALLEKLIAAKSVYAAEASELKTKIEARRWF